MNTSGIGHPLLIIVAVGFILASLEYAALYKILAKLASPWYYSS
jgi:hypothetical protein